MVASSAKKTPIDKTIEPSLGGYDINATPSSVAPVTNLVDGTLQPFPPASSANQPVDINEALMTDEERAEKIRREKEEEQRLRAQQNRDRGIIENTTEVPAANLSGIKNLYDRETLAYGGWLNNLQELTTALEQYAPFEPDAVIMQSPTNVMAVSSNSVVYQNGNLNPHDALVGAIFAYNNPASAKGTVSLRLPCSDRDLVMMTIAAYTIGLKIKNPIMDMDAVSKGDLTSAPPEMRESIPKLLKQFKALEDLNPDPAPASIKPAPRPQAAAQPSNVKPIRPVAAAPLATAAAPLAAAAAPLATAAASVPPVAAAVPDAPSQEDQATNVAGQAAFDEMADDLTTGKTGQAVFNKMADDLVKPQTAPVAEDSALSNGADAEAVKAAIQPTAAPSVSAEQLPVLNDVVEETQPVTAAAAKEAIQPTAAPNVPAQQLPVLDDVVEDAQPATTSALQNLLSKGDDTASAPQSDLRPAFMIEAAPVIAEEPQSAVATTQVDASVLEERAKLAHRPITRFPLLGLRNNGKIDTLCP